jgi:ribonuclease HI
MDLPPVLVYADGSCLGNPGPGGWAWAVPDGPFASGAEPRTTNQRMEVTAALEGLRALTDPAGPDPELARQAAEQGIEVVSDSSYVVNCFRQRWWDGWRRRGWRNSQGKPVANRDLWEPLLAVALDPSHRVSFRWVKGHSGDRWNDRVDALAQEAASVGAGTSGHHFAAP